MVIGNFVKKTTSIFRWLSTDNEENNENMNHVYFYGSQEFETSSYFSWMAGGKSLTEMAEIIFSFLQFLCLILILLAKLSSKNIKKKMEKFSSLILID